ncbi:MAG: hypothetical protein L3J92_06665 [Thermoplasmata archaeon]|jgi:hypothetical protein|nr:hypothetical protein [Thermoplasmata archaeon]
MTNQPTETNLRANDRTPGRWRWNVATVGLLGIALILLVSPMAQAASVGGANITIRAPFAGATGSGGSSTSSSDCGAGRIVHQPMFWASTGLVSFSVRAHATSCTGAYGDSGSATASETVTVPIAVVTGNDVIHAKWTVDASIGARLGGASCTLTNSTYSYCYSEAYAELSGYAYLYDLTNGSYWWSTNYWSGAAASSSFYDYCYAGNCSTTVSGSQHVSIAANAVWNFRPHGLNSAHSYELVISWYADASAYDYTYLGMLTGASETGWVTMAGSGYGAWLDSITVR